MSTLSVAVSVTIALLVSIAVLAFLAWCAAATVGAASVLIHDRTQPETLAEWALWVCRGIAYITGATLGGAFGVYALVGGARASAFVAVIIGFALVAFHMRRRQKPAGGDANGSA